MTASEFCRKTLVCRGKRWLMRTILFLSLFYSLCLEKTNLNCASANLCTLYFLIRWICLYSTYWKKYINLNHSMYFFKHWHLHLGNMDLTFLFGVFFMRGPLTAYGGVGPRYGWDNVLLQAASLNLYYRMTSWWILHLFLISKRCF